MSPDSLTPATCDFPSQYRDNGVFEGIRFKMAIFPVSRGKNRMLQGVENRGSLITVPLVLDVGFFLPEQAA